MASRAHRGVVPTGCDMDVCGARHKMRAYRARGGASARRDG
ncbi:CGNR zinc finger domain-containing protein [Streptomyces sp. WA6-1-16]